MAYVSTIVSAAASLGVLIGLISGIFFLVLTALKWVSRIRASLYEEELIRQKRFLINNSYLAGNGNADFRETKRAENDFGNLLNGSNHQGKPEKDLPKNPESSTQCSGNGTNPEVVGKEDSNFDTIKVREMIEKIMENIIGGSLDGTTVGQLSTHSSCKDDIELESTDLKQSNLKRLIKRIVSEAMTMPNIKNNLSRPKTSNESENEDFTKKSYEDILATAILNKIIDTFQNKNHKVKEKKGGYPKSKLRNKKMKRKDDDDDNKSDGDWSDTSRSDQLSLTIEEYIEEVTTALELSDEGSDFSDFETTSNRRIPFPESGRTVVDGADDENSDFEEQNTATELITSTSSWEENWLFQKKRLRSTPNAHHPVPVPMLVPNPSEDFRALVGGVDADDLSDMSDCSDTILEDLITKEEKPIQLPTAEPKKTSNGYSSDEENEKDNIEELQNQTKEEPFRENEEQGVLNIKMPIGEKNSCGENVKEKENNTAQGSNGDVEENLSSLNFTDLSQKDRDSSIEDFSHQYESINSHSTSEGAVQNFTNTDGEDCNKIICSSAEKEKEKWMNPISLADNPYSVENINKREQRKKYEYFRIGTYTGESIDFPEGITSNEFSKKEIEKLRFSRDYYINASKHPTGMFSPCFNQTSNEHDQVSKPSYEATSSLGRRRLEKNTKYNSNPDIADLSAFYFISERKLTNIFPPLQNQTMRRRHFSEVFKTSTLLNNDQPKPKSLKKNRYGSHTLKSRPRIKETIFRKPSLEKELSDFEQKSLREDLKHSLLRARGASPNFILNPVFKPDAVTKTSEMESAKTPLSTLVRGRSKHSSKGGETEFGAPEFIESPYHLKSGETTSRAYKTISKVSHESGYGSDSLDYSSDSLDCWRLTPPKTPEVVENSFVSIAKNRKNKEN